MALPQDQTLNISISCSLTIEELEHNYQFINKIFCSSYSEIKIYNRSAAIVQGSIHKCNSWLEYWISVGRIHFTVWTSLQQLHQGP